MFEAKAYKCACQELKMGAREAVQILETLGKHDALSSQMVSEYVLPALYAGVGLKLDSLDYIEFENSVYREFDRTGSDGEVSVSNEAASYLREVLESVTGGRLGLVPTNLAYDGFSREAYDEVFQLLGPRGRRYLGISEQHQSLAPDPRRARLLLAEYEAAEEDAGGPARASTLYRSDAVWDGLEVPDPWDGLARPDVGVPPGPGIGYGLSPPEFSPPGRAAYTSQLGLAQGQPQYM